MIVGMNGHLAAAHARQGLIGDPGDHFIDVHIGLSAGAGLPNGQRELVIMAAGQNGVRRCYNRIGDYPVHPARSFVYQCRSPLHVSEAADDPHRHPLVGRKGKILQAPLRLRAPISGGGNFDGAKAVGFCACHSQTLTNASIAPCRI